MSSRFVLSFIAIWTILILRPHMVGAQTNCADYWDHTFETRTYIAYVVFGTNYNIYRTSYFDGDTVINNNNYYKEYWHDIKFELNDNDEWELDWIGVQGPFFVREECRKFYQYTSFNGMETMTFNNNIFYNSDLFESQWPSFCQASFSEHYLGSRLLNRVCHFITWPHMAHGYLEGVGYIGPACFISPHGNGYTHFVTKQGNTLELGNGILDISLWPEPIRENDITPYFICSAPPCAEPNVICCDMSTGCGVGSCLGQCSCIGDYNGDGLISIQDFFTFLSLSETELSNSDLNGDCQYNFDDLVYLLGVFGSICE